MNWTAGNFSVGSIKFQFHQKPWRHKVTLPFCHLRRCLPLCFGVTLKNTREGNFTHYCSWLGRRKKGKVKQVFTSKLLLSPNGLRIGTLSLKMLISCFITLFTNKIMIMEFCQNLTALKSAKQHCWTCSIRAVNTVLLRDRAKHLHIYCLQMRAGPDF